MQIHKFVLIVLSLGLVPFVHGRKKINRTSWSSSGALSGSVSDTNISINGINTLSGNLTINAVSSDVTVTVGYGGATLRGSGKIIFNAQVNRTIQVLVQGDLTFASKEDFLENRLIILAQGGGTVIFTITPGATLNLQAEERTNGAHLLVPFARVPTSLVIKKNNTLESVLDGWVSIGEKSSIAFCSTTSLNPLLGATGNIVIDTTSTASSSGGITMVIANRAAFFIDCGLVFNGTTFILESVANTTQLVPNLIVTNQNGTVRPGSFVVLNSNTTIPNISADVRNQRVPYGFILGRKVVFSINDGASCIYGALAPNQPFQDSVCNRQLYNPSAMFIRGFCSDTGIPSYVNLGNKSALLFFAGFNGLAVQYPTYNELLFNRYTTTRDAMSRGHGTIVLNLESDLIVTGVSPYKSVIGKLSYVVDPRSPVQFSTTVLPLFNSQPLYSALNVPVFFDNSCFFLADASLSLFNICFDHEDVCHDIPFEVSQKQYAEPAYVGVKESFYAGNPKCMLYNSIIALRSPACFAGVDIVLPQLRAGNISTIAWIATWPKPYQPQLLFGGSFIPALPQNKQLELTPAHLVFSQDVSNISLDGLTIPPAHVLTLDGTLNSLGHCALFLLKDSTIRLADDKVSWNSPVRSKGLMDSQLSQLQCKGSLLFNIYGDENPLTKAALQVPQIFIGGQGLLNVLAGATLTLHTPIRYGKLDGGTLGVNNTLGNVVYDGFVVLEQN